MKSISEERGRAWHDIGPESHGEAQGRKGWHYRQYVFHNRLGGQSARADLCQNEFRCRRIHLVVTGKNAISINKQRGFYVRVRNLFTLAFSSYLNCTTVVGSHAGTFKVLQTFLLIFLAYFQTFYEKTGVRVLIICPGLTATSMASKYMSNKITMGLLDDEIAAKELITMESQS